MPLIHPFTHTFTHQRRLAAMQGTNQLVRSNWGLGVLLRDTSTHPGWDRTGNPPTARRQFLPPELYRPYIAPPELYRIYVKVPLTILLDFCRDICRCQDDDFSKELHVYSSRTMPGLILQELQQRGFVGIECVCLTGLPAVHSCISSWRGESDTGDHGLLSSSGFVYTKNGQKCHLQNCNNWYPQIPKEKVMLPSGKHASVPTFFECVLKLTSENTEHFLFVILSVK